MTRKMRKEGDQMEPEPTMENLRIYRIVRFHESGTPPRTIRNNFTLGGSTDTIICGAAGPPPVSLTTWKAERKMRKEWDQMEPTLENLRIYRIIRFHESGTPPRTIRNNFTLGEAQRHCSDPKTHGVRAGKRWFDGYDYMTGCRPKEQNA